eukprot:TRINITY_DN469_c1_g1_i1.p1 TRINITY_DN469_c1_g1~~TRINITY_DN469_c1_g1_i1.p1  ORF type:complete len:261 (-),score=87.07 TRINITY_DN469_c1_g1_i1:36-818(-)
MSFEQIIKAILGASCYHTFFIENNFFEIVCLKLLLSKLLGYAIVLGASMIKVPQLISMLKAKSAAGISQMMYYLELVVMAIGVSYNYAQKFPISTYGETILILIQDLIIIFLIHKYNKKLNFLFFFLLTTFFAILGASLTGAVDIKYLTIGLSFSIPLSIASRAIQIYTNFVTGDVGTLSFLTFFLTFLGAAARIFTTLQETSDPIILIGFCLSTLLNGIVSAQIVYYNSKKSKVTTTNKKANNNNNNNNNNSKKNTSKK